MNKRFSLATAILSLSLLSGAALAGNVGVDAESDQMMGHGKMMPHKGQAAIPGEAGSQDNTDDIIQGNEPMHADKGQPATPGADTHDNNTSMMHK
ncbi:MAG TPA: hypothetical protein ENK50_00740 [Sedimenticola sp.]|nr:hypothetical protein [Sedimenticola sp.]